MPSTGFKWKFDKGYAELLNTASVELKLEAGPSVTELEARPSTLFRGGKQLDLAFSLSRTLSGSAACGFAWVLEPAGRITAALIPEGAAYLGNFRVPAGHYGVQWKLNPSVSGAAIPGFTSAVSATAGSRLTQTWVELFPLDTPLLQALRDTWSGCVDPFDPAGAVSLAPSQVLRWDWSGTFRMEAGFAWSLEKGWEVGVSNPLIRCRLPFRTGVEFSGQALLSTGGHFYIQLSNRNDTLKFSLIREGSTESGTGASIGIDFSSSPSLKAEAGLLDPLLEPPEKVLRDCLKRKFRISLNAEALKLGRRKMVLRAGWRIPVSSRAVEEYADLVTGRIPPPPR